MLTEIIPGRRYLRRDGVEVEAVDCDTHLNYEFGTLITVRKVNGPRETNLEDDNDGVYRWRRNGPRPKDVYKGWGDEMFAGEVMRNKKAANKDHLNRLDLIKCVSHPNAPEQVQLDLF